MFATMARKGPSRRQYRAGEELVGLFVQVDPAIKALVDGWATAVNINRYEVVTLAVQALAATAAAGALPPSVAAKAQPALIEQGAA